MHKMRFPIVRVALMALALAVVAVMVGRGADNTAEATSFNPSFTAKVADPTPSNPAKPVHSDLLTTFALDTPDSFVQDNPPTINFIAPEWGVAEHNPDAIGALASEFKTSNKITFLGRLCDIGVNLTFPMHVATVDTSTRTSDFDLPGAPGGVGFTGQFVDDPDPDAAGLQAGVTHFPDFLVDLFDLDDPDVRLRARLFGWRQVVFSPVSLNFLTFEKGGLPGFPESRGYPTAVVLLNPQAVDVIQFNVTPDVCTPLAVVNTAFGETKDNPDTTSVDESGFPIFTNPSEKGVPYTFGLHTESQPDADGDDVANLIDTCPLDGNQEQIAAGRTSTGTFPFDSDRDFLDAACDPDPTTRSPRQPPIFSLDQDLDFYGNPGDNCPFVQNGRELLGISFGAPPFVVRADLGAVVGPNEQLDSDDDGIGDACDIAGTEIHDEDGNVIGQLQGPNTVDGHVHVVDFSTDVVLEAKHGVKLNNLGGPRSMHTDASKTYTVSLTNMSENHTQDIRVGLRGFPERCVKINGQRGFLGAGQQQTITAVPPKGEVSVDFEVSLDQFRFFCRERLSEITLQADACHPGDPDASLFGRVVAGSDDCPGSDNHSSLDSNPDDDAPISIDVKLNPTPSD